jgi:large subunit ribosomal protein L15
MPLFRRVPKRGFTNIFRKKCRPVNIESLNRFKEGTKVTLQLLKEEGLVKGKKTMVKILGEGKLDRALTVQAHYFSQKARQKIEEAKGKIEVIS